MMLNRYVQHVPRERTFLVRGTVEGRLVEVMTTGANVVEAIRKVKALYDGFKVEAVFITKNGA